MKTSRDVAWGAALAGALLLALPALDVLLGRGLGAVHSVLGATGLALITVALPERRS
jgi:hypothetical protein